MGTSVTCLLSETGVVEDFIGTHHQVEGFDGAVPRACVEQAVVDLHVVHSLLVALEDAGRRVCQTNTRSVTKRARIFK